MAKKFNKEVLLSALLLIAVILLLTLGVTQFTTTSNVLVGCDKSCKDTDQGSINLKGTVSVRGDDCNLRERTDYCVDANRLKEYNCDSTNSFNFQTMIVYCEEGCFDGACLSEKQSLEYQGLE
ncbi:MAG: hypothetical protein PHD81_01060 [Candidatus Nanoarchaeia archaeon]|nr:hypothetical protein [Candidatus Nanoarchaeia archaeon]MDD5587680.1 hypothetical protein [Candidatus Nanoarchaeia archaeon]